MTKATGWAIVGMGVALFAYELWSTAPVLVIVALALLAGMAIVVMHEANLRIRAQRARWEALREELRARAVDDEVEMMDEEGAFL